MVFFMRIGSEIMPISDQNDTIGEIVIDLKELFAIRFWHLAGDFFYILLRENWYKR